MMVFRPGDRLHVTAGPEGARLMLLGGETLGGPRYIWWNFVASSRSGSRRPRRPGAPATGSTAASGCRPATMREFIPLPPERGGPACPRRSGSR